jgi:outer membrane protein assembly factor BamA
MVASRSASSSRSERRSAVVDKPAPAGRVSFSGNQAIEAETLEKAVMEAFTDVPLPETLERPEDLFSDEARRLASTAVLVQYVDRGFLEAEVDEPLVRRLPDDENCAELVLRVHEGARYKVGAFEVLEVDEHGRARRPLVDGSAVRRSLQAQSGAALAEAIPSVSDGFARVLTLYRDAGYGLSECSLGTQLNRGTATVDCTVQCVRGNLVRIERVYLDVPPSIDGTAVERAIEITPGDLYNETKLTASKKAILGFHDVERVEIGVDSVGSHNDAVAVTFSILVSDGRRLRVLRR